MTSHVEIDGWKNSICFSASHLITGHKKCGQLHGHTYAIHAKIYGEKNKDDIILDFSTIKKLLREIAEELDHKTLIPEKNNAVTILIKEKKVEISANNKKYVLPLEDCVLIPFSFTTAENLAEHVLNRLIEKIRLAENIKKIEICIDEGVGQGAGIEKMLDQEHET
ncbi:MAG: 6-pyruvoyl tetrahydropterin synthase family protein [Thermoplasmata archaeon]|nr:MAG: 6-pyruvoyl tetrahydropterin synthase family protein [Thermoplasmata archaeon]RLF33826.1 MAG: 6-pyruvoyl tetrahydropterin synthase family protein [Thermoplasmata archaeon]